MMYSNLSTLKNEDDEEEDDDDGNDLDRKLIIINSLHFWLLFCFKLN